jgi:hypothetical protein
MRTIWAIAACLAAAGVLAGTGAARSQVPSGDTCTYSANGASYTVNIVTGSGVQQYGFAFGAPGLTVTNVGISGQNGNFTTAKLPANTGGAWISDTPLTGSVVATLTGSGSTTGPVVVVPSAAAQASYFDDVTCAAATSTYTGGQKTKALSFTVASRAIYSAAAHGWHLVVTIPVAGTVSAKEPLATSITVRPKPLVQTKRQSLASRGKVTLLLKATPQGQLVLASKGALAVKLTVTVDSRDGREAHKTLSLTLRK